MATTLPPKRSTTDITYLLRRLSPRGRIWDLVTGGRWTKFLAGCSRELEIAHDSAIGFVEDETVPNGTTKPAQTLEAWEAEFALTPAAGSSTAQRRAALFARMRAAGGCTDAYYESLLDTIKTGGSVTAVGACEVTITLGGASDAQKAAVLELFGKYLPLHVEATYVWT